MGNINSRINHVHARAFAAALVKDVLISTTALVRDAAEAPGRVALGDQSLRRVDFVLLNVLDLVLSEDAVYSSTLRKTHIRMVAEGLETLGRKVASETLESAVVDLAGRAAQDAKDAFDIREQALGVGHLAALLELDDVVVGNQARVGSARAKDGGWLRALG